MSTFVPQKSENDQKWDRFWTPNGHFGGLATFKNSLCTYWPLLTYFIEIDGIMRS